MKAMTVEIQINDQIWRIENCRTENEVKKFIEEINGFLPTDNC